MKMSIDIPEKTNARIRSIYGHNKCTGLWDEDRDIIVTAIYNGTPLDDCISRAEAILSMKKLYEEDCKDYGCEIPECFDADRAIKELKSLSSV